MKKELVFEIGADGGGITIYRIEKNSKTSYVFNLNEIDFSDEIGDQHQKDVYSTFEEAFNRIKYQYPWHLLYPIVIADKYKKIIADELVNKLNSLPFDLYQKEFYSREYDDLLETNFIMDEESHFTGLYKIKVYPIVELNMSSAKCPLMHLNTEGKIEVNYNSIVIKDKNDKILYILPSDKYAIETFAIDQITRIWKID